MAEKQKGEERCLHQGLDLVGGYVAPPGVWVPFYRCAECGVVIEGQLLREVDGEYIKALINAVGPDQLKELL